MDDPDLLVGFENADDASAYRLDDKTVILQSVDLFPPVVDDPYTFGQIAAANALSDIYAMGGSPKLAMNIFCCPPEMPEEVSGEILRGGNDKVTEASAIITGGHTLKDREPKYGLSVTGFVKPEELLTNAGARDGDVLILTKALGTGILNTAEKAGLLDEESAAGAADSMTALNGPALEKAKPYGIHGCTDITGFGLVGHCREMAAASDVMLTIDSGSVPVMDRALEMAGQGIIPAGAYGNREFLKCFSEISPDVPVAVTDILFDPQTSGGLLIAASPEHAEEMLAEIRQTRPEASVIGSVSGRKTADVTVI